MKKIYKSDLKPYLQQSKWLATIAAALFLPVFPFVLIVQILKENWDDVTAAYAELFAVIFQNYEE